MKTALIVPAYKPDMKMIALLEEFKNDTDFVPVVVDDGSGAECENVFAAIPEGTVLLRHPVNRGKGAALKTAMQHILDEMPECDIAVTADADGQHTHDDILRIVAEARSNPGDLTIGGRKFDENVPLRSLWGNTLTRSVFALASGVKVYDTQTGLRAFGRSAMPEFVKISGDRYEYEINMLLWAARNGMKIREVTIKTVYIDENASSHFHPFRDGFKIYACILKFSASSLIAFLVDYFMVLIMNGLLLNCMQQEAALLTSVIAARVVSAAVNFVINRMVVFKGNENVWKSALKYAVLAAGILVVNYLLIRFLNLTLGWPLAISKILVEILLFAVSFSMQGKYVYRKNR